MKKARPSSSLVILIRVKTFNSFKEFNIKIKKLNFAAKYVFTYSPIHCCHYRADLIWSDGPFNNAKNRISEFEMRKTLVCSPTNWLIHLIRRERGTSWQDLLQRPLSTVFCPPQTHTEGPQRKYIVMEEARSFLLSSYLDPASTS